MKGIFLFFPRRVISGCQPVLAQLCLSQTINVFFFRKGKVPPELQCLWAWVGAHCLLTGWAMALCTQRMHRSENHCMVDYHLHPGSSPFPCIDDNFLYTQNKINPVGWLFKLLLLLSSCSFGLPSCHCRGHCWLQSQALSLLSQCSIWFDSQVDALFLTGLQTQPGRQTVLQSSFFHQAFETLVTALAILSFTSFHGIWSSPI